MRERTVLTKERADISACLDHWAAEKADQPALTVDDRSWTFSEFHGLALKAASKLDKMGLKAGKIVALPLPNSAEHAALMFGAWRLGATPMPLPASIPDHELKAVMHAAKYDTVVRNTEGLDDEPLWSQPGKTSPCYRAQATGGSTGVPKVLLETNPSIVNFAVDSMGWTLGEAIFLPGPLYHSGPFNHLSEGLARGRHIVLMRKFDPERALELMHRHRPHFVLLVPTMMHRIAQLPADVRARADLSSIQRLWHTAAPCPPWLKERWIEWIGPEAIWEVFGGSEGVATTVINGAEWLEHRNSVGRVVVGEIVILDDDLCEVPTGQIGEIYMRNRTTPPRAVYSGDNLRRLHEDWESFGDLGWFDEEGYLFLADRRRDMIISGGANVYPAEVEAAIMNFPGVAEAVVFGEADEDLGERVCALVYPSQPGFAIDALLEHLKDQIVRYKIPRRIGITDEPIRNDAGKVRRSELRIAQTA